MGGIFSSSAPPAPAPVAMPTTDPAEEARLAREKVVERNRRGRTSLIKTSSTGVLAPNPEATINNQKTLLGE